ncbi:MAG: polysaccharide pyruvyl transferase family protein [Frankia sp.]
MRPVILANVFSRTNKGDSLLTDLAVSLLDEAGIPPEKIVLQALDKGSYQGFPGTLRDGPQRRSKARSGAQALSAIGLALAPGRKSSLRGHRPYAAYVMCPGGYLNGRSYGEAAGFSYFHLRQMLQADNQAGVRFSLPVTFGPMVDPLRIAVRRVVSSWDAIYVRDDYSLDTLSGLANVRRSADLVVLEVARRELAAPTVKIPPERIVINAREVSHLGDNYLPSMTRLRALIPDATMAVQASGDQALYEALGWNHTSFDDIWQEGQSQVVISVRLHGALTAIMRGSPAIHLAYDPKGWAAFRDLGLDDYVFNASNFDPDAVREAAESLVKSPTSYWAGIASRLPYLNRLRAELVDGVTGLLAA